MQVIRHFTAEKLYSERQVLVARRCLAEADSAIAADTEEVSQPRSGLGTELEALECEIGRLRSLVVELQATASSQEQDVIAIDDSPQNNKLDDEPQSTRESVPFAFFGPTDTLEQVKCMLAVKLSALRKKKAQMRATQKVEPTTPQKRSRTSLSPSRKASDENIGAEERSASAHCNLRKILEVRTLRTELQTAEENLNKVDVAAETARAECVDCRLVVHVGLRGSWRPSAVTLPSWAAIDTHLQPDWALRCGNEIFPLGQCTAVVDAISSLRTVSGHLLKVTTLAQASMYLRIGAGDAGTIMTKARSSPPKVRGTDILKTAVGALPDYVLCRELQDFCKGFGNGSEGSSRSISLPKDLVGQLRPYQHVGYSWLVRCILRGCGCILADDMGLGKTVQCIAVLLYLKQHSLLQKPALVIAPLSLVSTWLSELGRWAPSLAVHTYLGPNRHMLSCARKALGDTNGWITPQKSVPCPQGRRLSKLGQKMRRAPSRPIIESRADICITSYTTFRSDAMNLVANQQFSAMIVDEAQAIKNYSSQLSRLVKHVSAEIPIRIAISGTPIENRVSDLHSIFEFVMPGYLGSRASFEAAHSRPSSRRGLGEEKVACHCLQQLIGPFLLRRLKSDPNIAKDLPSKIEQKHFVEMTSCQMSFYQRVQKLCMQQLQTGGNVNGNSLLPEARDSIGNHSAHDKENLECLSQFGKSKGAAQQQFRRTTNVFRMLHALRQICNHPSNLDLQKWPEIGLAPVPVNEVEASGKSAILKLLLEQIFEQGEKVVVFCQYLRTIEMLASHIASDFGVTVHTLVGTLSGDERAQRIHEFQTAEGPGVMISTLGVGGVGITLHAACHVVHFDRCYNPAKESQGSDRVHRIGQAASCVFVHHIICRGTFEERIDSILQEKSKLSDLTSSAGERWIADLSDDQLRDLFTAASGSGEDSLLDDGSQNSLRRDVTKGKTKRPQPATSSHQFPRAWTTGQIIDPQPATSSQQFPRAWTTGQIID